MPKISVLLTCYNHIDYLPEALESIRHQTFRDVEIIAIDDGSTDGTREWLTENAKDCLLIFNETNLGTYGSLNRALSNASGDYIAILNDDDVWHPEKLEQQLTMFERYPDSGLCHTHGKFIDGQGATIPGSPLGFEFPRTENGNVLLALFYQNKIIASAVLVKRSCFEVCGDFNTSYFGSGDWEMWFRIAECFNVCYADGILTYYRVHGKNASHKLERIWRDDQLLREWIRSRETKYLEMKLPADELNDALAHNDACLGTIYKLNGNASESRRAYLRSLRRKPGRVKSYLRYALTFAPQTMFRRSIKL